MQTWGDVFPFSFTGWCRLNLFEVLQISVGYSWGPMKLCLMAPLAHWKPLQLSRPTTPTTQGRVLTLLQADGSCLLCSPKTKTSQLSPETRESSAAGVRARACYSSSCILCNTLLFNTIKLRSSAQWVTPSWPSIVHSSAFPVFPILWKKLHK